MALHKQLFGILFCLVSASCASAQKADVEVPAGAAEKKISARVEAQIKILERLSAKSKLTCANLKTWKGEIRVDDIEYYFGDRRDQFLANSIPGAVNAPAEFRKKVTGTVTFSLDAENDTLYSRFETQSVDVVDSAKGTSFGIDLIPFNQVSIVTPEAYTHFQPNVHYAQPEGKRMRIAFCDGPEEGRRQFLGAIVDPRLLLGYGRTTWENLDLLIRALRENGELKVNGVKLQVLSNGVKLHVSSDGTKIIPVPPDGTVTTTIIMPGLIGSGQLIYQQMRFVDDNLVSLTVREGDGRVHQRLRWSYMEQNGVDVPSGLTYLAIDSDGERITFQRILHVLDSTPRATIAPATFTRGNIGLVEGDRFVDRVAGTVSRLDNGVFRSVPAEQAQKWLAPR